MNTNIAKILVPLFSLTLLGCDCRNSHSKNGNIFKDKNNEKTAIDIYSELNALLTKQGEKAGTGISFTMQYPIYNNGIATTYNVGLQKLNGTPVTNNSLFQIGSNSKAFLVVVMLQLEAEGELSLDDKLSKFFPNDYPYWQEVTIRQMLNMTSGVPEYTPTLQNKLIQYPTHYFSTDEILNAIKDKKLDFTPGSYFFYSNTNYVLANKIIEKITKNNLANEIEKRIFKKLNLNHSFYINHLPKEGISSANQENIMSGYLYVKNIPENIYGMDIINSTKSISNGAGSITSSSGDLNIFIRNLFSDTKDANKALLNASQLNEILNFVYYETDKNPDNSTTKKLVSNDKNAGYGLGMKINHLNSSTNYFHTGGTFGFLSKMNFMKDKNISYVYLTNTTDSETFKSVNEIVEEYISQKCM